MVEESTNDWYDYENYEYESSVPVYDYGDGDTSYDYDEMHDWYNTEAWSGDQYYHHGRNESTVQSHDVPAPPSGTTLPVSASSSTSAVNLEAPANSKNSLSVRTVHSGNHPALSKL